MWLQVCRMTPRLLGQSIRMSLRRSPSWSAIATRRGPAASAMAAVSVKSPALPRRKRRSFDPAITATSSAPSLFISPTAKLETAGEPSPPTGTNRGGAKPVKGPRRTAGQIRARADSLSEARRKHEAEQRSRDKARREQAETEKRQKHLKSLAGKEEILWVKVEELIATKQMKRYDEAVSLLQDLRDLADLRGRNSDFSSHLNTLLTQHLRKGTLVDKVRRAKLLPQET